MKYVWLLVLIFIILSSAVVIAQQEEIGLDMDEVVIPAGTVTGFDPNSLFEGKSVMSFKLGRRGTLYFSNSRHRFELDSADLQAFEDGVRKAIEGLDIAIVNQTTLLNEELTLQRIEKPGGTIEVLLILRGAVENPFAEIRTTKLLTSQSTGLDYYACKVLLNLMLESNKSYETKQEQRNLFDHLTVGS